MTGTQLLAEPWSHIIDMHEYSSSSAYFFLLTLKLFYGGDKIIHICLYYQMQVLDYHVCDKVVKKKICSCPVVFLSLSSSFNKMVVIDLKSWQDGYYGESGHTLLHSHSNKQQKWKHNTTCYIHQLDCLF